jgi:hypothetical protein
MVMRKHQGEPELMLTFWKMNGNSKAGPWSVPSGSTQQTMIKDCHEGLHAAFTYLCILAKNTYITEGAKGVRNLLEPGQPLGSLVISAFKPKMEVIARDNVTKKVRNIQGVNTLAAGLPQMIQSPLNHYKECLSSENVHLIMRDPKAKPNYTLVNDLAGYSNTNSFCTKLVDTLTEAKPGRYYIMKMSDNLYFGYKGKDGFLRTYSMDGKRMECCHDDGDRTDYLSVFKAPYRFESEYIPILYDALQEKMLINGTAVYGKHIIKVPGLSSGAPGTAEVNGMKMF